MQIGNLRKGTAIFTNPQAGRVYDINDVAPTLNTAQGGGRVPLIVTGEIVNGCNRIRQSNAGQYRIRRLTPKECYRLMGFKDEQFDKAKQAGISDTQLYKQAGNSIVVDVLDRVYENKRGEATNV